MNKASIVEAVHAKLGSTKVAAEEAVDTVINSIIGSLREGQDVSIAGLGIFEVRRRPAREGRNPQTGEKIMIPAMNVAKFKPAKGLKEAVK